jgi:tRNA threonylcarbamoyl adenosine modification protein YeaZ
MLLAVDTATRRAAVAVGNGTSEPVAARTWTAGYHHGEELLGVLEEVLHEGSVSLADLDGIVAGIGPGSFTGLRVGLATAKGLSYGLAIPIVGVGTAAALAAAAWGDRDGATADELTVLLPAGPHDRYAASFVRDAGGRPVIISGPVLLPGGTAPPRLSRIVAVDLDDGSLPPGAAVLGTRAQTGLGAALLSLGAAAFAGGAANEVAEVVPAYVTLPRGVGAMTGEISWSRDLG